ncbi:hypothetical protein ACFL2O_09725 [Thermodesulfobacteriota bacterium]
MRRLNMTAIAFGIVLSIGVWGPPASADVDLKERYMKTGGDTRGIDVRKFHVFLADGSKGLKIINLSNPNRAMLTGFLSIPDSFVEQVAVDKNMAVLTDTRNRQIHFVNTRNVYRPELQASLRVEGDIPRRVIASGGKAYVVEYGDDPTSLRYFSGIEVFSYTSGAEPESSQLKAIENVRDVVFHRGYVFVAAGHQIMAYKPSASGLSDEPIKTLMLSAREQIQSVTAFNGYLFVFGSNELYVVGFVPIPLRIPGSMPGSPLDIPSKDRRLPKLELKVITQIPVDCESERRRINATIADYGGGLTSEPNIVILLTTLNTYGLFVFNQSERKIRAFTIHDLSASDTYVFRNVNEATEGRLRIFDAIFPEHTYPGWLKGGVIGIGALGENGFGWVHIL